MAGNAAAYPPDRMSKSPSADKAAPSKTAAKTETKDAKADTKLADAKVAPVLALHASLAAITVMLEPFMPVKMRQLASALGLDDIPILDHVADLDLAGRTVARGEVLFPRPDRE